MTKTGMPLHENYSIAIPDTHFCQQNLWISKPEDLYQGRCMNLLSNLDDVKKLIKKFFVGIDKFYNEPNEVPDINGAIKEEEEEEGGEEKTDSKKKPTQNKRYFCNSVILQKYIEKPLLYNNRKFDMRVWVLLDHNLNVYLFKYKIDLI